MNHKKTRMESIERITNGELEKFRLNLPRCSHDILVIKAGALGPNFISMLIIFVWRILSQSDFSDLTEVPELQCWTSPEVVIFGADQKMRGL